MTSIRQSYQANYSTVGAPGLKEAPVQPQGPMQPNLIQDSLELKRPAAPQIQFGKGSDFHDEEFDDTTDELLRAAGNLDVALKTYRERVKTVSRLPDVLKLLEDVDDALDNGPKDKIPVEGKWNKFVVVLEKAWGGTAKASKQLIPYIVVTQHSCEDMKELLDSHTALLKKMDERYDALVKEGILTPAEKRKYVLRRQRLAQEKKELAEVLSAKALVIASWQAWVTGGFRIDQFGEYFKGFKNIVTLKWSDGWNSQEIRQAQSGAKESAAEFRQHMKSAVTAAKEGLKTNYIDNFRAFAADMSQTADVATKRARAAREEKARQQPKAKA